ETGDAALFQKMAAQGYVKRLSKEALNESFTTDMGCNSAIAKALIKAGANPKANSPQGNSLHAVSRNEGACQKKNASGRAEMMRALVALGVAVNGRVEAGKTPLMGCDQPEVAKVLLDAGADVNATAKNGRPAILSANDERVVLLMLRAGAKPNAQDSDG